MTVGDRGGVRVRSGRLAVHGRCHRSCARLLEHVQNDVLVQLEQTMCGMRGARGAGGGSVTTVVRQFSSPRLVR